MAGKEKSLMSEVLDGVRIEAKHIRENRTYSVIRVDKELLLSRMGNINSTPEAESVDEESLDEEKQESKKNSLMVVKEIGKGSFSTVYKVKNKDHTTDGVPTTECVKVATIQRWDVLIKYEIDLFSKLKIPPHEHIITQTFACQRVDTDAHYLGLEFFDGDTLTKIIQGRRNKNIPIDHNDVVIMLLQQTQAIEYLLKSDIYHCDITPNNVMYNRKTQTSKLIDFGLAKHKNSNADEIEVWEKVVKYAALGGAYAAPERHADKEMGDSSDLYSLAAVLFHLVILESPPTWNVTQYRKEAEEARKSGVSIPDTAVQERLKTHEWNDDNRKWTIILLRRMLNEASDERPLCSDILDNIRDNMQTNA